MRIKPFLLIAAILTALTSAVPASAEFRWGPTAGFNINTLKFKQNLMTIDHAPGASAGVDAEMMFPGIGFGLGLGLRYELLGAKLHMGEQLMWSSQGYGTENIYVHNIQIPFHLRFKWTRMQGLEDYVAPFVFGGPTFDLQAAHTGCKAIKFSGGDLGLTAGIGAEIMRRWQVSASYTWGMTYVMKANVLTDYSARNRTWDIRVTYFF